MKSVCYSDDTSRSQISYSAMREVLSASKLSISASSLVMVKCKQVNYTLLFHIYIAPNGIIYKLPFFKQ